MAEKELDKLASGNDSPEIAEGTIGFKPLLAIGLMISIIVPWAIYHLTLEPELTPFEKSEEVIELLRAGRTRTAHDQALRLLQAGVQDPDVGGNLEFVVGVAQFRKARYIDQESESRATGITNPIYELARQYLEQASQKTIKVELKPEWAYVIGACYFHLGNLYAAREHLEQAYDLSTEFQADTIFRLGECYLDPNVLQASLINSTDLVEAQKKRRQMKQRILDFLKQSDLKTSGLQLTEQIQLQIQLAEYEMWDRADESALSLLQGLDLAEFAAELNEEELHQLQDQIAIIQGRILLLQSKYAEAREILLQLIKNKSGLEQKGTLQAHYLIGLTYAADNRIDLALDHLEKPSLINDADVCFPANLHAGEISRQRGLHEEALAYYLRAIGQLKKKEEFTNRWIDLPQARTMVQNALDEWGSSGRYEHFRYATDLAERCSLLFTPIYTNQLLAEASRKRAEFVQQETDALQPHADAEMKALAIEHWKRAGQAYARLANSMQSSDLYGQNLWEAAQLYRKGNAFENALQMVNLYLDSNPRTGIPSALVFKSRLLIDIDPYTDTDELQEAQSLLETLLRDYPKDQYIYEAQLLLGQTNLELERTDQAIAIWRELLLHSPLTPDAAEWQAALFALGRTLFLSSDSRPFKLPSERTESENTDSADTANDRYQKADEAIQWLNEFVRRNPQHPSAWEARWLLAKGLRFRMQLPASRLNSAETENTRVDILTEIDELGRESMEQFKLLGNELATKDQTGELDEIGSQFLRDCYLEPAHIQYDLGKYDSSGDAYRKAIERYSNAAFHFTGDPIVLIAYYRIAECYRALDANEEARRQLEQARVILNQLKEPFSDRSTNFTRSQWETLLDQSIRLYDLAMDNRPTKTE